MTETNNIESFLRDLPDPDGANRFFGQLRERNPSEANKLLKNSALLSDVLTLASYSPLLGTTLLQNHYYFNWLKRQRNEAKTRDKEELLESLARFSLTNSEIEPQIQLARFRRRELLRIYLRDIRHLGTIAEITEEISNLADAILEHALRLARQEMDNRFGNPQEIDEKGRAKAAQFCVVSLGKLGSNELNYSSDIDLLFLYSTEGTTSGNGSRGAVTNREYFTKLAELVTKIVGQQTGEGAAYRVDLRLRPHGRVGALAISLAEAVKYYSGGAQAWERQTLIRARASAGDTEIFKEFFAEIEGKVYSADETVENALRNVKLSKEKINLEHHTDKGYNVKLGTGGIREIEFIAQALQLAYGGRDRWLRAPHTLKSLARLADRKLISDNDLTELSDAYDFLRRLEHHLQMEHGLQTHLVPHESEKLELIARKMNYRSVEEFNKNLSIRTENVNRVFREVFGETASVSEQKEPTETEITPTQAIAEIDQISPSDETLKRQSNVFTQVLESLEKAPTKLRLSRKKIKLLEEFCEVSPQFAEMLIATPTLIKYLPNPAEDFAERNYESFLGAPVEKQKDYAQKLSALRKYWAKAMLEIAAYDAFGKLNLSEAKKRQTSLAEASLKIAVSITESEIKRRYPNSGDLHFAVLGLGKLGGRGMDYGSDLDLVLIYDDEKPSPAENLSHAEFYSRVAEIFVAAVSNFTRDGNLYRIDLRLRPDGKNGATILGKTAFTNYLANRAAIWEWLAYVKLRGVAGNLNLAEEVEHSARRIIHENAFKADKTELKNETFRVRERLEQEKSKTPKEINIKYSAGGMLDVYFAVRFLQLRDNIADTDENRSTLYSLQRLYENSSLTKDDYEAFSEGYYFLSCLDHNLRLIIGRTNRLPLANQPLLKLISTRMNFDSISELSENLTLHRLNIRNAYENILK